MLDNVIAIYKKLPVVIGVTICTLPLWLKHIMAHSFPFRYSEVNVASDAKEFLSTKTAPPQKKDSDQKVQVVC